MSYTQYLTSKEFARNTDGSDPTYLTEMIPVTQQASEIFTGKYLADHLWICGQLANLQGKVLTIIDASIADHGHKKAVKDLIRNEWSNAYNKVGTSLQSENLLK